MNNFVYDSKIFHSLKCCSYYPLLISHDLFHQGMGGHGGGGLDLGILSSAAFKIIFTKSSYGSSTVAKLETLFLTKAFAVNRTQFASFNFHFGMAFGEEQIVILIKIG